MDSKRNVQTVVLSVARRCYTENVFVCEPDKVHQAGRIALLQIATTFSSSDLVIGSVSSCALHHSLKACQTHVLANNSADRPPVKLLFDVKSAVDCCAFSVRF